MLLKLPCEIIVRCFHFVTSYHDLKNLSKVHSTVNDVVSLVTKKSIFPLLMGFVKHQEGYIVDTNKINIQQKIYHGITLIYSDFEFALVMVSSKFYKSDLSPRSLKCYLLNDQLIINSYGSQLRDNKYIVFGANNIVENFTPGSKIPQYQNYDKYNILTLSDECNFFHYVKHYQSNRYLLQIKNSFIKMTSDFFVRITSFKMNFQNKIDIGLLLLPLPRYGMNTTSTICYHYTIYLDSFDFKFDFVFDLAHKNLYYSSFANVSSNFVTIRNYLKTEEFLSFFEKQYSYLELPTIRITKGKPSKVYSTHIQIKKPE